MKHPAPSEQPNYAIWFSEAFRVLDATPADVARKIGVDSVKIYNIINGKFRPNYETIQQILAAYPRLNANYLLKGQSPMLDTPEAPVAGTGMHIIELNLLTVTPDTSLSSTPETYPLLIRGNDADVLTDCVIIKLTDNTMAPKFRSGMLLLARPVPASEWDYINSALVLVKYRTTLVVRRIRENELLTRSFITLYADNPEAGFVHVRRDDIHSIWHVLEIVGGGVE